MFRPALLLLCLLAAGVTPEAVPLSLEEAVAEAQRANASLPVAQAEMAVAAAQLREAHGKMRPQLSLQGDVIYLPPKLGYGQSPSPQEDRLQLVGRQPLYAGGGLRAAVRQSEAHLQSAAARYRAAEKDVELQVRTQFATGKKLEAELHFRTSGVLRLRDYLTSIQSRRAGGQGLTADMLKTQAQLAGDQANVAAVQRALAEARVMLNDLLGRDPWDGLTLAPLPSLKPPEGELPQAQAWERSPEVLAAQSDLVASRSAVEVARALRRPHLDLEADTGWFGPGFDGTGTFGSRLRSDYGLSVGLFFSWQFWDFGAYRGVLAQAQGLARQGEATLAVDRRKARAQWELAQVDLTGLYEEVGGRARAMPLALDAYLQAESLYRGGAGTTLEVLDAYNVSILAQEAYSEAVLAYRVAEANARRWGAP